MTDDTQQDSGAPPPDERPEVTPPAAPAAPSGPVAAPPPPGPPAAAPPPPYRPGYAQAPGVAVPPHWVAQVPPPTRPHRSPVVTVILVVVLVFVGFMVFGAAIAFMSRAGEGPGLSLEHVGIITVEGVIRDGGAGGFLSGPPGARGIMQQIRQAREDDATKAVVLLINSPGGSAAASAAIYEELTRLRQKKKVVACMTDVAASGGYYIASGCDQIVAQGSTLTGSIGVIFGGMGYYGLMKKLGLTDETITAGKYKAMGRGSRPMTAEERAIVVSMLDDIYTQFINAVAEGRKMDPAKVRQLAQGRIYTGAQAKKCGLVDQLGNFHDAVKLAGKLGGIRGEPKVKYYGQAKGLLDELAGTHSHLGRLLGGEGSWTDAPLRGALLMLPDWGLGIEE